MDEEEFESGEIQIKPSKEQVLNLLRKMKNILEKKKDEN